MNYSFCLEIGRRMLTTKTNIIYKATKSITNMSQDRTSLLYLLNFCPRSRVIYIRLETTNLKYDRVVMKMYPSIMILVNAATTNRMNDIDAKSLELP